MVATMRASLPSDADRYSQPPALPLVEATLSLVQELVRRKFQQSKLTWEQFCFAGTDALITQDDMRAIESRILATGHRFAWSAGISVSERPEAYQPIADSSGPDAGFAHPNAPIGPVQAGRALRGVGDNVVRQQKDLAGTARYIRTRQQVLSYLTNGVPPGTIAVIDDSGGTLTAPLIEHFAGVICAGGTVRSHLGILTREYNIPCLMNAKLAGVKEGDKVLIETTAAAKTTEDYQQGIERVARIWLLSATEDSTHG
jgi:phosphohistidine swiveling domain-containing protein